MRINPFNSRTWHINDCIIYVSGSRNVFIDKCPDDKFLEINDDIQYRNLNHKPDLFVDTCIYGGFITRHFGHTMCESMHRLWAIKKFEHCDNIIFFTAPNNNSKIIRDAAEFLGINSNKLLITDKSIECNKLIIPERGTTIKNRGPSPAYLDELPAIHIIGGSKVFVTRRNLSSLGYIAGEQWLAKILEQHGFVDFAPEKHSYATQINTYATASQLIMVEGSSIHGLDIIGRMPNHKIGILNRRQFGIHKILKDKAGELFVLDCIVDRTHPDSRRCLAFFKIDELLKWLEDNFDIHIDFNEAEYNKAVGYDAINFVIRNLFLKNCRECGSISVITFDNIMTIAKHVSNRECRERLVWLAKKWQENYE